MISARDSRIAESLARHISTSAGSSRVHSVTSSSTLSGAVLR